MVTLFECWNGGTVHWDQIHAPQIQFPYPPVSAEVVTFFQLSTHICELLTDSPWKLTMGGQRVEIPMVRTSDLNDFIHEVENNAGYISTPTHFPLGDSSTCLFNVPVSRWVNKTTGRADLFSPYTGLIRGQRLLTPPKQSQQNQTLPDFDMRLTRQGTVEGKGASRLFTLLSQDMGYGFRRGIVGLFSSCLDVSNNPIT